MSSLESLFVCAPSPSAPPPQPEIEVAGPDGEVWPRKNLVALTAPRIGCDAPFPTAVLPAPVADMCQFISEKMQVHHGLPPVYALGIASAAATFGRLRVRMDGEGVGANVYIAALADPGERKSPALACLSAPLIENEIRRRDTFESVAPEFRAELALARKDAAKAEKAGNKEELVRATRAVEKAERALGFRGFLIENATPEAVVAALEANDGRGAVLASEGNAFERMFKNAYRNTDGGAGGDEIFRKGFSGEAYFHSRKGAPDMALPRVELSALITFQPGIYRRLVEASPEGAEAGLFDRFLVACFPPLHGERKAMKREEVPANLAREWERIVNGLWDAEGHSVRCDGEAWEIFAKWFTAREAEKIPGGKLRALAGHCSKLESIVLRLAGLLAAMHREFDVTAEGMERATAVADWFLAHRLALHAPAGALPPDAVKILRWARGTRRERLTFTRAEIFQNCKKTVPGREALDAALAVLDAEELVRVARVETDGRPASVYAFHPDVLERW